MKKEWKKKNNSNVLKMEEQSRKKDLEKKIKKKIEECNSIINITLKAVKGLNITQKKILFAKENLKSTNYNAHWNKNILSNLRDQQIHQREPSFDGYFKAYDKGVTGLHNYSRKLLNSITDIENKIDFVSGATSSSNANMGTGCRILGNYLNDNRDNVIVNNIALENPWDNPYYSRNSLKERLFPIKAYLADTLDSLWDSLLFEGRREENRPPALLMREFISDFLHTLTSRDDILKLDWCRTSDRGNPTQPSMVIYIILGSEKDFNWDGKIFKPIVEIATRYREIYQKLNKYTHYRGERTPKDVKIELKLFAEQIQSYTLEILKLRKIYSN